MYIDRSKALCLVGSLGAWSRLRDLFVKVSCVFFCRAGQHDSFSATTVASLAAVLVGFFNRKHLHEMPVRVRYPRWLALGVDKTQKC
mmetsp:Transcript_126373/g.319126  ORF Transcript_126373/g.319126 Transcript_126373/m.319126 type:complete len:87 (+) Transcript_126373:93-353(+)